MVKPLFTWLLRVITGLMVLVLAGVLCLLYVEAGRIWLAETAVAGIAELLDQDLHWQGIRSPEPNLWTVDEVAVYDDDTFEVKITGLRLDWWPGTLLAGRIILDELSIETIDINIINMDNGQSGPGTDTMLPVTVHAFDIGSLTLKWPDTEPLQQYRLTGDLDLFSGSALLVLNTILTRPGTQGFNLSLSVLVRPDHSGTVSGWYNEPPQGPAGTLIGLPEGEPLALSLHADFTQTRPGLDLIIRDLNFGYHDFDVTLQGRVLTAGDRYTFNPLRIDIGTSRHILTGAINGQQLDLQLAVEELPLQFTSIWTGYQLEGGASGQLDIQGTLSAPRVSGTMLAESSFQSLPLSVSLSGTASGEELILEQAEVTLADTSTARSSGSIDFINKEINLQAEVENLSMEMLRTLEPELPVELGGVITASATLSGPWLTPLIEFDAGLAGNYKDSVPVTLNVRGNGRPVQAGDTNTTGSSYAANLARFELDIAEHHLSGAGRVRGTTDPIDLTIDDTYINIAGSEHSLSGSIQGDRLALNLNLTEFPLDSIAPLLAAPLAGTASAALHLDGTLSEPRLSGTLNSSVTYQALPLHLHAEFSGTSTRLDFRQLKVSGDETDINAAGIFDLAGSGNDLKVTITNTGLGSLHRTGLGIPEQLQGQVNSEFTVSGSRLEPVLDGSLNFTGTWLDAPVVMLLAGRGSRESFIINDLEIKTGDVGYLSVQGQYHDQRGEFRLTVSDLPSELLHLAGWEHPAGMLNGGITLHGSLSQPQGEGRLVFSQRPAGGDTALPQYGLEADLKLVENSLDVLLTLAGDNARTGKVSFSLPWRRYLPSAPDQAFEQTPLQGSIRGEASLQEICLLLLEADVHNCRGSISADLSLAGTFAAPGLEGIFGINDGFYENLESGTNLHDLNLDIRAAGKRLEILRATATDGDQGLLELEGRLQWRDAVKDSDIELLLKVNNSHLLRRYDMDGTATGILTLTGNHDEMYLSGTLAFRPFNLALEALLQEDIPTLEIIDEDTQTQRVAAARQKWDLLPAIHINVDLLADQQAYLRGSGLEAELQGKLQVQGTYPDPVLRGSFRTIRGSVQILDKKFNLGDGEIRLEDEIFSMLIPATYTGKTLEVRAELYGTVDALKLSLSSTPPYPEDEIISQLLFGKTTQSVSPLQAVRLANAINTFRRGGRPLFDPLGKLEQTLPIDRLTFEDSGDANGVLLGVGKYIHEKVYVEVETGTGAGETWQGNVEIELLPNLNLENTINGETGFGNMGIHWKKDY